MDAIIIQTDTLDICTPTLRYFSDILSLQKPTAASNHNFHAHIISNNHLSAIILICLVGKGVADKAYNKRNVEEKPQIPHLTSIKR
ncbi:unnamed protein product [Ceratitis capitata]|uniref:(Mediterranean fruit fly) hypothetical protein n=1 Tax=Ceratitis capitata TaxID=7213 RepID=A0A811U8U0_CERCA|nr:unnamed protein product [Ceratitis capitata]